MPYGTRSISRRRKSAAIGRVARSCNSVTERSNAATEERLKSGHAVGGMSIV